MSDGGGDDTIELDSEAGRGTTVAVVLPAAAMTAVEATDAAVVDAPAEVSDEPA